jgi:hypothetical protein
MTTTEDILFLIHKDLEEIIKELQKINKDW